MASIEKQVIITAKSEGFDELKREASQAAQAVTDLADAEIDLEQAQNQLSAAQKKGVADLKTYHEAVAKAEANLKKASTAMGQFDGSNKATRKSVLDNGGAVGILNELTGGLASTFKDAFEATEVLGGGLKGLKGALIGTGIGALVIIIGELIANWEKWTGLITGATKELEKQKAAVDALNQANKNTVEFLSQEAALLAAAGAEREKVTAAQDKAARERLKQIDEELKNTKLTAQEQQKLFDEARKLENERDLRRVADKKAADDEILDNQKKAAEQAQKERDKAAAEQEKKEAARRKKELDVVNETAKGTATSLDKIAKEQEDRDKKASEKRFESFQQQLDIAKQLNDAVLQQQEDERIRLEVNETAKQNLYAKTSEAFLAAAQIFKEGTNEQAALQEASLQIAQVTADGKIQLEESVVAASAIASKILGQHTAAGKALGVASATIDMYKGIMAIWGAASMGNPIVDIAVKTASSAIIAVQGITSIKKILAVKVPGGGGGAAPAAGGTGAASSVPAPQFNIIGQSQENQLAATIAGQQGQPQRAYVVSTEVTSNQSLDRNIINNATFLG